MPLQLKPNSQVTIVVPWNGGIISTVNIGFSGSSTPPLSYIELRVPPDSSTLPGGSLIILMQVGDVCQGLPRTCQEAHCTAQVVSTGRRQPAADAADHHQLLGRRELQHRHRPHGTPGCSTEATMCNGGGSGKSCWDGSGMPTTNTLRVSGPDGA
jgi:hypothetical protein